MPRSSLSKDGLCRCICARFCYCSALKMARPRYRDVQCNRGAAAFYCTEPGTEPPPELYLILAVHGQLSRACLASQLRPQSHNRYLFCTVPIRLYLQNKCLDCATAQSLKEEDRTLPLSKTVYIIARRIRPPRDKLDSTRFVFPRDRLCTVLGNEYTLFTSP